MDNKTCYISVFYLGDRRREVKESKSDKLFYLKTHLSYLSYYKHNLKDIFLVFNLEEEHKSYLDAIQELVPSKIQGANVTVILRKNEGYSYGGWDEAFKMVRNDFDYYFVQANFDQYLIDQFNFYGDTGYICPLAQEPLPQRNYKKIAGHSVGISSGKVLNKILDKFGDLPHSKGESYKEGETSQILFSYAFIEVGYNIYDIRDEYRVAFARTEENVQEIWKIFYWNKDHLILPAIGLHFHKKTKEHTWYASFDNQYQIYHKPSTFNETLLCKQEKLEIEHLRDKPYDYKN